jgi:hypothetical protein
MRKIRLPFYEDIGTRKCESSFLYYLFKVKILSSGPGFANKSAPVSRAGDTVSNPGPG